MNPLIFTYLLMMLLQVFHIFEEIGCGAYKVAGNLKTYLIVASVLVTINFTTFMLILQDIRIGYYLGLFTSGIFAIGNGLIHLVGWLKTKSFYDNLGAGVFTGIGLGITGILVLIQILGYL